MHRTYRIEGGIAENRGLRHLTLLTMFPSSLQMTVLGLKIFPWKIITFITIDIPAKLTYSPLTDQALTFSMCGKRGSVEHQSFDVARAHCTAEETVKYGLTFVRWLMECQLGSLMPHLAHSRSPLGDNPTQLGLHPQNLDED